MAQLEMVNMGIDIGASAHLGRSMLQRNPTTLHLVFIVLLFFCYTVIPTDICTKNTTPAQATPTATWTRSMPKAKQTKMRPRKER